MADGDGGYSLETRVARTEQRVSDLDTRLTSIAPMMQTVVQLVERELTLRRDLAIYVARVDKLAQDLERRDDEAEQRERDVSAERRTNRRWMIGLTVSILIALLGAATVLATAGVPH